MLSKTTDRGLARYGSPQTWLTPEERARAVVKPLHKAIALYSAHFTAYVLTLWGAVAPLPLWANLIFAVANGLAIAFFFSIAHDCSHRSFVSIPVLNRWGARIAFLPMCHAASLWDIAHNVMHHSRTSFKGMDDIWAPKDKAEYDALPPFRRRLERIYRGPAGPLIYYMLEVWLRHLIIPIGRHAKPEWRRHVFDSTFVLITFMALVIGTLALGKSATPDRSLWLIGLLAFIIPMLTWNYVLSALFYMHHTHADIPWFDDPDEWTLYNGLVQSSTHVEFDLYLSPAFNGGMAHTAHHVMVAAPCYNLTELQKILNEKFENTVTHYRFSIRGYLRTLDTCKLFDYRNKCWTDFDGKPTSKPIVLQDPPPQYLHGGGRRPVSVAAE